MKKKPKITKLTGIWEKTIGLAFKKNIQPIFFQTRWGIHTVCVKEPIDVIVCDDNFVVKKIIRDLKPSRIFVWNPKYQNIIETPSALFFFKQIKVGDRMKI